MKRSYIYAVSAAAAIAGAMIVPRLIYSTEPREPAVEAKDANAALAHASAAAQKDGATAEKVAAWTYRECAAAAGVIIDEKGNSPPWFFYQNVKNHVANELIEARDQQQKEAVRSAIEAAAKTSLGSQDVTVTAEGDDVFRITRR